MSSAFLIIRSALTNVLFFVALVCTIVLAGALLGAILFFSVGKLFGMDYSTNELLQNGLFDGGFYALIWAPGLSFVALVMRAHKQRNHRRTR